MSENFAPEEKQLIEKFINSLKEELNNPEILIEYDVTEHGKYIGSEHEIPRGNAASESWYDSSTIWAVRFEAEPVGAHLFVAFR